MLLKRFRYFIIYKFFVITDMSFFVRTFRHLVAFLLDSCIGRGVPIDLRLSQLLNSVLDREVYRSEIASCTGAIDEITLCRVLQVIIWPN
jgi:hypothetical protein